MIRYNPPPLRIFFVHVITRKVVLKIRVFFFGVIFEMGYVLYMTLKTYLRRESVEQRMVKGVLS